MRILALIVFTGCLALTQWSYAPSAQAYVSKGKDTLTATDSILINWLGKTAVTGAVPKMNRFYFWLEQQEIDSVLQQKNLLRHAQPQTTMEWLYQSTLMESRFAAQPIAQQLRSSERIRKRECWSNMWSFITETHDSDPRNQLVEVVLEDSAWIALFRPESKKPFVVVDVKGNVIPELEAQRNSRRIAVVLFQSVLTSKKLDELRERKLRFSMPGNNTETAHFRSFMLVNETMIKSWHHAVPGLQEKMLSEIKYLLLLDAWMSDSPKNQAQKGRNGKVALDKWNSSRKLKRVNDMFFANIRVTGNAGVDANPVVVKRCIAALRERWPNQKDAVERYPSKGIR
jgi:hypothetical protein